jgi:hypothetical protein
MLIKKWASEQKAIPLLSLHQNNWKEQVGVINVRKELGDGDALYIKASLLKSTKTAQEFRDYLTEIDELNMGIGLSIGAIPTKKDFEVDPVTKKKIPLYVDGELVEGSVVPIGANKDAFGYLAKKYNIESGGNDLTEEKIEEKAAPLEPELSKPLGKYENMNECMAAMMKEGKDKESASKICGKMEQEHMKNKKEEKNMEYDEEIKKIYAELETLKKENIELREKKIEEIVLKAIKEIPLEKRSAVDSVEKDLHEGSVLNLKSIKTEA